MRKQADSFRAVLGEEGKVIENFDVGRDGDAALIERDGQGLAQEVELHVDILVQPFALAVFVLGLLGRVRR